MKNILLLLVWITALQTIPGYTMCIKKGMGNGEICIKSTETSDLYSFMAVDTNFIAATSISQTLKASNALPPGSNFDLSAWKLQTLDTNLKFIEIKSPELIAGYTSALFYTDSTNGSMVFRVPSNGSTTANSTYPRVELRQTTGGANWKLSDQTEHYLTAECKVINVAQAKPQVIIGQVHGSETNSELLKLRWTGYQAGKCYIEARLERDDSAKTEYGVTLASGLSLGDLISYIITMKSGKVSVWVNGVSATQTYTPAYFGTTDAYYFKAGAYLQYNGTNPVVLGQTQFYKLSLARQSQTINFNPLPEMEVGDADFNPGAVATSGLKVSYSSSNPAVATFDGDNIHMVGAGITAIKASQAGNLYYSAAPAVSQTLTVILNTTGIDELSADMEHFQLYPNPASNQVLIRTDLPAESKVRISFYSLTGQLVKQLLPFERQIHGETDLLFSVHDVNDGVYFVSLRTDNFIKTFKLIVKK